MARRAIAASLAGACTMLIVHGAAGDPAVAQAGTAVPSSPLAPAPFFLWPAGEPSQAGGSLPPGVALAPLRLSLTGGFFPLGGAFNCGSNEEASGNTVHGFPVQRYTMLRLTPNLVLHGFSTMGCPIDAGAGGALTQTVPLKRDLWLVASAGTYAIPGHDGVVPPRTWADARIDVVKRTADDRFWNVGLGRIGRSPRSLGLNVGGSW